MRRVSNEMGRLITGLYKIHKGTNTLAHGARKLSNAAGSLGSGIEKLSSGTASLVSGLSRLAGGAEALEENLAAGAVKAGPLESGLEEASVKVLEGKAKIRKQAGEVQEQTPGLLGHNHRQHHSLHQRTVTGSGKSQRTPRTPHQERPTQ